MQYCTKCKSVCENGVSACSLCKRVTSLRPVKDNDLIFLVKTRGFEADELAEIFDENLIDYELKPVKAGVMSSVYDSNFLPDDKNIFIKYKDFNRAKELAYKEEEETENTEEPVVEKKNIAVQIISILVFMALVALVTLGADAVSSFITSLFK